MKSVMNLRCNEVNSDKDKLMGEGVGGTNSNSFYIKNQMDIEDYV
jgi:hypothetical protein